jgi:hypothetical protein
MTGYQSKRAAAQDKLDDDDDTQVYKDHGDALTIAYQSGYYDGKKVAQPAQEPVCPECKAGVLYECVACSSNNYPPQRTWVGLTKEDMPGGENPMFDHEYFIAGMVFAANILKEKNNGA